MQRSHVRGLLYVSQFLAVSGLLVAFANCGGGERPPPAADDPNDAGKPIVGELTFTGLKDGALFFGEAGDGLVFCGRQSPLKTITINNSSDRVVNFSTKLSAGEKFFKVAPEKGGIPANGSVSIQVSPEPIPQISAVTPDLYAGTLDITTSPSAPPTTVRLHQTAKGAIVTTATTKELDFGGVKVGTPSSKPISFTNSGNAEATANLALGSTAFSLDPAVLKLAGGATGSASITLTPVLAQDYNDTLAISFSADTVLCQEAPKSVDIKGKGTTSVGVSPGTLNFGQVDCGSAGTFQPITVTSTSAMIFTPVLGKSTASPFTLADNNGVAINQGVGIPLGAASSYTMRIIPLTITKPASTVQNALGDTLTVTTDVPSDVAHIVALQETAKGAIFAFSPAAGFTHTGTVNATFSDSFNVVNSGNAPAAFTLAVSPQTNFASTLTSGLGAVGSTPGTINTTNPPAFNTTVLGTVSIASSGVLCADLPPSMPLKTETGQGTSITYDNSSLNFGPVNCGATFAAGYKTLTITSPVTTSFQPNLGKGEVRYKLADSSGGAITLNSTIPLVANTPYVMRVVPQPVATRPLLPLPANTEYNDTLTITTPIDPVKSIPLQETPQGVVFTWGPDPITIAMGTATVAFSLTNAGTVQGAYTITTTGGFFTQNLPTPGTVNNGVTVNGSVTRSGTGIGTMSLGFTPTLTMVLCKDLPGDLNVIAN